MTSAPVRHALWVVGAYTALFGWLYAGPAFAGAYLAESDLYEYFLPAFLSPPVAWSSNEFGGMPAFADPAENTLYPPRVLFGILIGSWTAYVASAFVLAASFTYAYAYVLTGSRLAAACAGLVYGLSEALMEHVAHLTSLHVIAWLPLIVLALDRLRGPHPWRWTAIGAFAVASCVLAGHPQPALYALYASGLYALVGGLAERARWRYYLAALAMVVVGVLITAIKTVPTFETSFHTARQVVNVGQFVSHANTPEQMLSLLFPTIAHEGREAPTYVGLATLLLAFIALQNVFRSWRVAFWAVVAGAAFLIGAGDATPVAGLAFELPLYDKFRVGARHLFLAAFGAATLAAFGVAALHRHAMPPRAIVRAVAGFLLLLASGAAAIAVWPERFEFDDTPNLGWSLPLWNSGIWIQLAIGAAAVAVCVRLAHHARARSSGAALLVLLVADLLFALPYGVTPAGIDATVIPADAVRPSVHAARLAADLRPAHQRLLAPAGTQLDAVVPAAFARLWQIPIAGGYGPMLLARHGELAMMGTNGSVDPLVLADDNAALDLLAVKYVVLETAALTPTETFDRGGVRWAGRPFDLPVGPPECGQRHPRTVSYALPPDVDVAALAIVARLRCSEDVIQGTEVATVKVFGAGDDVYQRPLVAGVDVADAKLADPELQRRAKHTPPRVFDADDEGWSYIARLDFPRPMRTTRLQITMTGTAGWLQLRRLSVIGADGGSLPQALPALLLSPDRWHRASGFSTSRVTDRPADEAAEAEAEYAVFENQRALPRAWVAHEVVPLADEDILTAVHHSRLPDGRPFDPRRMALVPSEGLSATTHEDSGASAARVRSIGDGVITVDVTTAGGGFLVLSESHYPGWRARIGEAEAPVHRTNHSLQGVVVPPGRHVVTFEFRSTSRRAGADVSLLGLVALAFIVWRATREPRRAST